MFDLIVQSTHEVVLSQLYHETLRLVRTWRSKKSSSASRGTSGMPFVVRCERSAHEKTENHHHRKIRQRDRPQPPKHQSHDDVGRRLPGQPSVRTRGYESQLDGPYGGVPRMNRATGQTRSRTTRRGKVTLAIRNPAFDSALLVLVRLNCETQHANGDVGVLTNVVPGFWWCLSCLRTIQKPYDRPANRFESRSRAQSFHLLLRKICRWAASCAMKPYWAPRTAEQSRDEEMRRR